MVEFPVDQEYLRQMEGNPTRPAGSGLVDHDQELRHRVLGWLHVGLLGILGVYVLLVTMVVHEFSPRMLVFPLVVAAGLVVQRFFWNRGWDLLTGHSFLANLLLATTFGLAINGINAPVVLTPIICTFLGGYLLGSRMAWFYGLAGLALVWTAFLAQRAGWISSTAAPSGVWFRVLVILDLVAVQALVFLALGLRSAIRFHKREEKSLERALDALALRRAQLESQVRARTTDLERANQDLVDFSRAVSHDLKGPVRAVRGYLDILGSENSRPEAKAAFLRLSLRTNQVEAMMESALNHGNKAEGA